MLLTTQYMEEAEHLADQIAVIDAGRVIARGTALELKERLGGAMLEARVSDGEDLARAAAVLAQIAGQEPRVDAEDRRLISIPSGSGTTLLLAAGRRLEEAAIGLDDLGIRRPSLDDVFLTLTGGPAGVADPGAKAGRGERSPPEPIASAAPARALPPAPAPSRRR